MDGRTLQPRSVRSHLFLCDEVFFMVLPPLSMAHPFMKMLDKALRASDDSVNEVFAVADKLRQKGYPPTEIRGLLVQLEKSLIDLKEAGIVAEAIEEFDEE